MNRRIGTENSEKIRIALAQMEVIPGQPEKNLKTALEHIDRARSQKAEIIVLPELAVSGYMLGDDRFHDRAFVQDVSEIGAEIIRSSDDELSIVFGNIMPDFRPSLFDATRDAFGNDGRFLKYNSAFVGQSGKPAQHTNALPLFHGQTILPEAGATVKTNLPLYKQFEDQRYFLPYKELAQQLDIPLEQLLQPFNLRLKNRNVSIGILVCEDIWVGDYIYKGKPLNPAQILVDNGAELLIAVSTSPYALGKNQARIASMRHLQTELLKTNSLRSIVSVNAVGLQNNGKDQYLIDGQSSVNEGKKRTALPAHKAVTHTVDVTLNVTDLRETIAAVPETKKEKRQATRQTIVEGIKKFCKQSGLERMVIGLSGGVDSALAAVLFVEALGAENVLTVNMPSKFNDQKTKDAARYVAEALGTEYLVSPIENLANMVRTELSEVTWNGDPGAVAGTHHGNLVDQNLQARIRSADLLSGISSKYIRCGYSSNGNKTELATGYFTLDGDGRGALAAIADLWKTEVIDLCIMINEEAIQAGKAVPIPWEILKPVYDAPRYLETDEPLREVIPSNVEEIVPSAELGVGQKDPFNFPYHDLILQYFVEHSGNPEDLLHSALQQDWATLSQLLGIGSEKLPQLIQQYYPSTSDWINDLEWMWKLYNGAIYKHVQSVPVIVTSSRPFGYNLRRSITQTPWTRKYLQHKAALLGTR